MPNPPATPQPAKPVSEEALAIIRQRQASIRHSQARELEEEDVAALYEQDVGFLLRLLDARPAIDAEKVMELVEKYANKKATAAACADFSRGRALGLAEALNVREQIRDSLSPKP